MTDGLRVLWATDGSECALAAVPMIQSLVLPAAASIEVLAIAPRPMLSGARPDPVYLVPWTRQEREAARAQAFAIAQDSAARLDAPPGIVTPQAAFGHPIQEIVRAADRIKADLIVMGAKGHSALKMMLLGSVAQGVLEYTKRPLLLVRPGSASVSTAIVGIDGSKECLKALQFLRRLAPAPGVLLVLARVVQLVPQRPSSMSLSNDTFAEQAEKLNNEAMRRAEDDLAAAQDALDLPRSAAVNEILVGRPGEQLVNAAAQRRADLIVVGSRAPSRVRKYLVGSTAELVAREADASVLIVR